MFTLFGAFVGTILVTDPRSGLTQRDRPILRTGISTLIGAVYAFTFDLTLGPSVTLVLVFGGLGFLGMSWARYVEF